MTNTPLRVGIFQNKPIVYYENGAKGIFVQVLEDVANKEGWELEYVQCELRACMDLLHAGRLDLMTSVGRTPSREKYLNFSEEPIWTFWGTIYARNNIVHGVFDLKNLRIGVRRNNIVTTRLKQMLQDFEIPASYHEFDHYEDAYRALTEGIIDAIAVNNTYGFEKQKELFVYKTPVVFHPFSAYFASPKQNHQEAVLRTIDQHVQAMKMTPDSLLHRFTQQILGPPQSDSPVRKIVFASIGFIILTVVGMSYWRYLSIIRLNKELLININDRKTTQKELEKQTSELRASNQQLEKEIHQREKIEEELRHAYKMEAIGTLAGGIAHDFNNLLAAILGYTEMARDKAPSGSSIIAHLDQVRQAAERAKELVRQILSFSRRSEIQRKPLILQPLIKEGLKLLHSSIPSTIRIHEDIEGQNATILGDPTQIHQILLNLCTNGYQAMELKGGELTVALKTVHLDEKQAQALELAAGNYALLQVSDTGTGIEPALLTKIFDPYFTTKQLGRGTGMGLAIIHGIVSDHGGKITVKSKPGQGSCFSVYLPAVEGTVASPLPQPTTTPQGRERILFVDDEQILGQLGQDMLERLGYQVTFMASSPEALLQFEQNPHAFDVVITDQTMPLLTGSELARKMLAIRPDTPIILCTGYSNIMSEEATAQLGIRGFLSKPYSKHQIGQLIRNVLGTPTGGYCSD